MAKTNQFPRLVRSTPDPLGLFIRSEYNDQRALLDFLHTQKVGFNGVVFNAVHVESQNELLEHVLDRKIDAILDPKTQEMGAIGRYTEKLGALPWGANRPHTPNDFSHIATKHRLVASLTDYCLEKGFTQILAPTHYLKDVEDEWLQIDLDLTRRLWNRLDKSGGDKVDLIYSLTIPYKTLRDHKQRRMLVNQLKTVPMDMLWLKIDHLGADATAPKTINYISCAADFHELGIPIVADYIGGFPALALLAFGAVGGIAHGITNRERFSASDWHKPSDNRGRAPQRRIYVPQLDLMIPRQQAEKLFESFPKARSLFGCQDKKCCQRGTTDMVDKPAHHFLYQRTQKVAGLNQIPEQLRAPHFLERDLRPSTDQILKATKTDWGDEAFNMKLQKQRVRIDTLRVALGEHEQKHRMRSYSPHPQIRATR
ncbi:hypothetical protein DJ030_09950 [bacterium endosymbiont of Escarpia laminata]|nr:MAG: hypothetical protein DJ031_14930 [bacterium endosymbiont of Escarpia laminata]RLJ19334.1 MAG: hypothetical protein DJ030_09950 [bacterium endosymbiont of Escarpia laminata]